MGRTFQGMATVLCHESAYCAVPVSVITFETGVVLQPKLADISSSFQISDFYGSGIVPLMRAEVRARIQFQSLKKVDSQSLIVDGQEAGVRELCELRKFVSGARNGKLICRGAPLKNKREDFGTVASSINRQPVTGLKKGAGTIIAWGFDPIV
jgi:hypothetical protein